MFFGGHSVVQPVKNWCGSLSVISEECTVQSDIDVWSADCRTALPL